MARRDRYGRWEAWEDNRRRQQEGLYVVNPNETRVEEVRREEGVFQQAQLVAALAEGEVARVIG